MNKLTKLLGGSRKPTARVKPGRSSPMRMLAVTFYAMTLTLGTGVPLAYAGCMDDVGDAIGAFFSGGVSVAVCQTIETVNSIIRTVQTMVSSMSRMLNETITAARQIVDQSASSIERNTRTLVGQLNDMVNEAQRLANTPLQAARTPARQMGAAGSPASAAKVQPKIQTQQATATPYSQSPAVDLHQLEAELHRGAQTMAQIRTTLQDQAINQILSAAQLAKEQAGRHLGAAIRIGETSIMSPLRQLEEMLVDLTRHPERIFDPTSLVNESMERLTVAMTQVVEQMHQEVTNEALATIRGIDRHMSRVIGDTDKAKRIHDAMIKAHRLHTQTALNELRAANGSASTAGKAIALSPAMRNLLIVPDTAKLKTSSINKSKGPYAQQVKLLKSQATQIKDLRSKAKAGRVTPDAERRAKAELDRMLKSAKNQAEADRIKLNLKTQLQSKYRNNAKALEAINRNFDNHFAAYMRARPAPFSVNPAATRTMPR